VEINKAAFTFYDVGGQRAERRKWCVLFLFSVLFGFTVIYEFYILVFDIISKMALFFVCFCDIVLWLPLLRRGRSARRALQMVLVLFSPCL
jgi:hypothetical protein